MTNEEAKMQIQAIPEKIWDQLSEPDREAMEMAFSALQEQEAKAQLSAEGTTFDLISRQEAIDAECEVCQIAPKKERGHNCTYYVHGCKEIECLRELPSAQPESEERTAESAQNVPKEDLIFRKAAIDYCYQLINVEHQQGSDEMNYGQERVNQTEAILHHLELMPSAQPERKNGRWEMKPDPFGFFGEIPVCSECGCTTKMRDKTKFCPHCGAQMEGQ